MTYQLLNENYVPARNLKNTNIRNTFFFKCLYLIYHLIKAYTKLSHQLAVRPRFTQNCRSLCGLLYTVFSPIVQANQTSENFSCPCPVHATTPVFKCSITSHPFATNTHFPLYPPSSGNLKCDTFVNTVPCLYL